MALKKRSLMACTQCKKMITSHTVCKHCGYYKGREVVNVLAKKLKKQEKKKHQKK